MIVTATVEKIVRDAVSSLGLTVGPEPVVGQPTRPEFGDFTCTVAMALARSERRKPRELAEAIAAAIRAQDPDDIEKLEIAGAGFINITLSDAFWQARLRDLLAEGPRFGRSDVGGGTKVLLEYVSANPTGPLHIGHARGAAVADTIANLLDWSGHAVAREFYINDVGAQMQNLGRSVWYRYAETLGHGPFPPHATEPTAAALGREPNEADRRAYARFGGLYFGDYVKELGAAFAAQEGERFMAGAALEAGVLEPTPEAIAAARDFGAPILREEQQRTLEQYGVRFDRWYSEKSMHDAGMIQQTLDDLRAHGQLVDRDGAVWFATTNFGDEKDRVVVKSDGAPTYFIADIAYHRDKLLRGFDRLINAWGADHHGHVPKMRWALAALGYDPARLDVVLIQMVRLLRGGQEVKMSKRSGSFVTLQEVIDEVGQDAARYLMLIRASDSHFDFDLDLARKATNDNPVFYVQYGHARACSILAKARAEAPEAAALADAGKADLSALSAPAERDLLRRLAWFPDDVALAARRLEPHRLTTVVQELVRAFHAYYSAKDDSGAPAHKVVSPDTRLTAARLVLTEGVRTVLANGLAIAGVSAPQRMDSTPP